MENKTVAIYSGEIPSSTFIERLVIGLSNNNTTIYLFGNRKHKTNYPNNIKLFTYSNRVNKLFSLLKYSFLLLLFKANDKRKLDEIIKKQNGNNRLKKLKYYPVLYHKPDIFHLQWAKGIEDWLWVQEFGMKYVLSLRGTHLTISPIADAALKKSYQDNFKKLDGFHAVSNAILGEAKKYEPNLLNAKVIYSGLDLDKLVYKKKTQINEKLKIISIGRSHWVKGYSYALDAFSILKQENFKFEYTIFGIDTDEELLFQRNQLNLEAEVIFKKTVAFEQIIKEIQEADIVVLPSIEEGIANVVLEAMALGTLAISTNCGGMEEIVKNNENGFIVPIRTSIEIAETIKKVNSISLADYNEMSAKARVAVEKQHSNIKMISDFNILYEDVLND